jgi:molybdopterin-guanine dinucleotide biosynthesis protein A
MNSNRSPSQTIKNLYGLVLSGGKSTRMGMDKGSIAYHSRPQREYLYEMLEAFCEKVFMSIRADQQQEIGGRWEVITDNNEFRGPFNGILSAHKCFPAAAWLILACDLPLINSGTMAQLIEARDPGKDATAYATRESGLPEPLAAIWEPGGLEKARVYLRDSESSCPRKFLLKSDVTLLYPENDQLLCNANSPVEYREIRQKLASQ